MRVITGPDSRLSTPCAPCGLEDVSHIVNDLMRCAIAYGGQCAGLAANQRGFTRRVCIVKIGRKFKVFIDPEIIEAKGEKISIEGCLSWPFQHFTRKRAIFVRVKSRGKGVRKLGGQAAIAIQHEIDHLDGKEI